MNIRQTIPFLMTLGALLLVACGPSEAEVQARISLTKQAEAATLVAGVAEIPAEIQQPQNSPTPLSEAAAATLPLVSVSQNTNCRSGPGSNYALITTIDTSQSVEVLKVYNALNYVVVRNPSGSSDCWLWLQYASPSNFAEWDLPIATQPPTPAATHTVAAADTAAPPASPTPASPFDWAGAWEVRMMNTANSSTWTGGMNCVVAGSALTCAVSVNPGGLNYTFSGTIAADLRTVSGSFSDGAGASGNWQGQIKSDNPSQFVGSLTGNWEWCGARSGSSLPSPCKWP
ncbi:MAG: hypothetical protein KIS85_08010 [Anaerolineales bacterium]|nr:hypothetical protein [Anaerolineales bacterium]